MTGSLARRPLRDRLADRYAAWAVRKAPPSYGLSCRPEPLSLGEFSKAKQMLAGQISFAGHSVIAPNRSLWDIDPPSADFAKQAHGFDWLDDFVALGTTEARQLAQTWTEDWLNRFGQIKTIGAPKGIEEAWSAQATGRRITRILHHITFLTYGLSPEKRSLFQDLLFSSLSRQAAYLARRAQSAPQGLPRFEALLGQLYAGLMLQDQSAHSQSALTALEVECETQINRNGILASRNPEKLAEVLLALGWAAQALEDQGQKLPQALTTAIDSAAVALRILRLSDGSLPRMHGSGGGRESRLDQALTATEARPKPGHIHQAMGYIRLQGGRSSVILDAEAPPNGPHAGTAHASTGAFEMTSGRRVIITSCGSGDAFGAQWHKAGRATQSHSVLALTGISSSRFGRGRQAEALTHCAKINAIETSLGDGSFAVVGHDGWSKSHGLTAARELQLSFDGNLLNGWDTLIAHTTAEQIRLKQHLKKFGPIGFSLHFHLHPETFVQIDAMGSAVNIRLASGERWQLRHDGQAQLQLQPSAYLQNGQEKPLAAKQIVLSGQVDAIETRIGWTLAKAQDTAQATRDSDHDDLLTI